MRPPSSFSAQNKTLTNRQQRPTIRCQQPSLPLCSTYAFPALKARPAPKLIQARTKKKKCVGEKTARETCTENARIYLTSELHIIPRHGFVRGLDHTVPTIVAQHQVGHRSSDVRRGMSRPPTAFDAFTASGVARS